MLKFIKGLVQCGVYPQTEPEAARQITLTNGITLTIFFFIVPFSFIFYFLGYTLLGPLLWPIAGLFTPVFYFNKTGKTLASRLTLIVLMNLVLGSYAVIIGRESGIHLLFFVFVGIPFLIFSLHERALLIFSTVLSSGLFYFVQFGSSQGSPSEGQRIVYIAMITLILLWTVINFVYFSMASRQKEAKILSQEKKFRSFIDRAPDAMVFCAPDSAIQLVNSQFRELFGFADHEVIGKNFSTLVANNQQFSDHSRWLAYCDTLSALPGAHMVEQVLRRKDTTAFPAELSTAWLETDAGIVISTSIRDITERKQLDSLKIQTAATLARSKDMEQFAFVVSHDLRSPVVNAMQLIEIVKQEKNPEESRKLLSLMSESVGRMNSLILDLLKYSVAGQEGELTLVDCQLVVAEIQQDLASVLSESRATLKVGELPSIKGHRTAIRSLFQNLISNAIKFQNGNKTPLVEIFSSAENGLCKFGVRDNGIGIDPKHSAKIFDVFHRLHTNGAYEGNGIGLAHCKKIIDHHGGKIWVESAPGQGSTFYFTLAAV